MIFENHVRECPSVNLRKVRRPSDARRRRGRGREGKVTLAGRDPEHKQEDDSARSDAHSPRRRREGGGRPDGGGEESGGNEREQAFRSSRPNAATLRLLSSRSSPSSSLRFSVAMDTADAASVRVGEEATERCGFAQIIDERRHLTRVSIEQRDSAPSAHWRRLPVNLRHRQKLSRPRPNANSSLSRLIRLCQSQCLVHESRTTFRIIVCPKLSFSWFLFEGN